jgi:hypothetical protein
MRFPWSHMKTFLLHTPKIRLGNLSLTKIIPEKRSHIPGLCALAMVCLYPSPVSIFNYDDLRWQTWRVCFMNWKTQYGKNANPLKLICSLYNSSQNLNKTFIKWKKLCLNVWLEDKQIAVEHVKTCSKSLVFRSVQIKTIRIYYYSPIWKDKLENSDT